MSLIDTIGTMADRIGVNIEIPPPPPQLEQLPLLGEPIVRLWDATSGKAVREGRPGSQETGRLRETTIGLFGGKESP